jgi:hypothetical protein
MRPTPLNILVISVAIISAVGLATWAINSMPMGPMKVLFISEDSSGFPGCGGNSPPTPKLTVRVLIPNGFLPVNGMRYVRYQDPNMPLNPAITDEYEKWAASNTTNDGGDGATGEFNNNPFHINMDTLPKFSSQPYYIQVKVIAQDPNFTYYVDGNASPTIFGIVYEQKNGHKTWFCQHPKDAVGKSGSRNLNVMTYYVKYKANNEKPASVNMVLVPDDAVSGIKARQTPILVDPKIKNNGI